MKMVDREDRSGRSIPARLLEEIAVAVRTDAGLVNEPQFDVARSIWRLAKLPGPLHGLRIVPLEDEQMGNKEAWASAPPPTITIRQSRYANPNCPETRFMLGHELFHIVLHPEARSFLVAGGNKKLPFHHKDDLLAILHNDQSHEVQADVAARAYLMPRPAVISCSSPSALAELCNVPLAQAKLRYAIVKPARQSPAEVRAFLFEGRLEVRRRLWNELRTIAGEDPDQFRQAGLYRIAWNEFEMMSPCGWTIENRQIIAYFEIRAGRWGK